MRKGCGRLCAAVLAAVMAVSMAPVSAAEKTDTGTSGGAFFEEFSGYKKEGGYREYLQSHAGAPRPSSSIVIPAGESYRLLDGIEAKLLETFSGKRDVLLVENAQGSIEWSFTVEESGLYCFRLHYQVTNESATKLKLSMKVDDMLPFQPAEELEFPRLYTNASEIVTDNRGNDIRPRQAPVDQWMAENASDREGIENKPYAFYLSKGVHTLALSSTQGGYVLKSMEFYNQERLPSYQEYASDAKIQPGDYFYRVQGENAAYKSDSVLYPVYDRSGPDTVPSDPVKLRMNTIGGGNFSKQGQYLIWDVKAPEAGYYKISLRFRQNVTRGLTSYRRLYINGQVPFAEADAIPFRFKDDWQQSVLGDENGEWLFYLKKGLNTLRLEVVPGKSADISAELNELVYSLNYVYRKILMITGATPDALRDYQLETQLPGLTDALQSLAPQSDEALKMAEQLGNETTGNLSSLEQLSVLLKNLVKKPDTIATRITRLRDSITSVSDLIQQLQGQPLEIDYLSVCSENGSPFEPKKSVWTRIRYSVNGFLGSFVSDYNSIGSTYKTSEVIDVWVNLGRDQSQTLKTLVDSMFTPQSGIAVNVSLVQQSLVQATLSGSGPDVVLFVGQNEPVNLAARSALLPLDTMDGFQDMKKRFSSEAFKPYTYNGHVYGMPVQENFPMMFYRTDIFEELGLKAPSTWQDFYNVVRVLQRNNMTAGIPNMPSDTQMQADISVFAMLVRQNGGSFYNGDLSATNFMSETAIGAFEQWTSFYADYGLPNQFDFYNRFRSGEMPVGISSYTLFNQLMAAAPEIRGMWKMVPVPGVREGDDINNTACGNGTCAVILKGAKNRENAWTFVDWFTDKEAQVAYGQEIESVLGVAGRYDTANQEAFLSLSWDYEQQTMIQEQWDSMFLLEQVPGGYFVDRNLTNAFRNVVFKNANARQTLVEYDKVINKEIRRKRKEFGLE